MYEFLPRRFNDGKKTEENGVLGKKKKIKVGRMDRLARTSQTRLGRSTRLTSPNMQAKKLA